MAKDEKDSKDEKDIHSSTRAHREDNYCTVYSGQE